ncbi:MAG: hypothetical protein AABX05_00705, partial [Nanoarchaeota archaeon]
LDELQENIFEALKELDELAKKYMQGVDQNLKAAVVKAENRMLGFQRAIVRLTKITPLGMIDGKIDHAHFYAIREEGLYRACSQESVMSYTPITEKSSLDSLLEKVVTEPKREINIYKVTNPSELAPPEEMLKHALRKIYGHQEN